MSQHLVKLFQQTIKKKLHLKRNDRVWSLNETPLITMEAPSRHSLGFSLDCVPPPFDYLFESNPPSGVAKMCDGIIVLSYKNKAYIFVVEQKTASKEEYKKQLVNGKYFCDWLLVLLKEHGHYDQEVTFIALLCWQPREKSPRKGRTHHGNDRTSKKLDPCLFFEVKNESHIHLLKFIP